MTPPNKSVLTTLLTAFVLAVAPVLAQTLAQGSVSVPTDAQVRELEQQLKSLRKQLDDLKATRDAAARQRLMQQNWRGMQDYIGRMHDNWGMGYPWMTGHSWAMCGPQMMGGSGAWWPVPKGVNPDQYTKQMRDRMQRMQEQMNGIAQATDSPERQRLMQEHWQGIYQDMQTMRGMGWMWGGGSMMGPGMMHGGMMHGDMMPGRPALSAKPLPDAESLGARLVATYCSQCHAAPQPDLHTPKEWASVTRRMHARMASGWQGVKIPTEQEMKTILAYVQKHAR